MTDECDNGNASVWFVFTFSTAYCLTAVLLFWWFYDRDVRLDEVDRFVSSFMGLGGTIVGAGLFPEMFWLLFSFKKRSSDNSCSAPVRSAAMTALPIGSCVATLLFGLWYVVSPTVGWNLPLALCSLATLMITFAAVVISKWRLSSEF